MPIDLDDPLRGEQLRCTIQSKASIRQLYAEAYRRYQHCLDKCLRDGYALELGSGGGFAQEIVSELITSDIISYNHVDLVADATSLPFSDETLRFIGMINVFHHIPDVEAFLREAQRCLGVGGRLLIIDQHLGYISQPILKYFHHEPYCPRAPDWTFAASGPLSGANTALPWMVFVRDRAKLVQVCPKLRFVSYTPHSPLRYWIAGGLKPWNLLPQRMFDLATRIDRALTCLSKDFGSFVDIELVKA